MLARGWLRDGKERKEGLRRVGPFKRARSLTSLLAPTLPGDTATQPHTITLPPELSPMNPHPLILINFHHSGIGLRWVA